MIDLELSEHTVLVTGSAHGIGREIVLSLAASGAKVAIQYQSSEQAAIETEDDAEVHGATATCVVQGDVTRPTSIDQIFQTIESTLGPVDILINNVGSFAPEHWEAIDTTQWNQVLDTNFNATCWCSKRALSGMRENEWGRIINIGYASSEKGLVNTKNFPYFVAKTGVLMFTRMLAADTQFDGITVNAVSPYVVENSDTFPADLPRNRPASFQDVVHAVRFFLAEDSAYISGENIEVDGGWLPETV